MLTTLTILSRHQGQLARKPQTEAEYFARFATGRTAETPPPVPGRPFWRVWLDSLARQRG